MLKHVCILVTLLLAACGGTMIENPHGEASFGIGDCDAGEAGTAGSSAGSAGSSGAGGAGGSAGSAGSGGSAGSAGSSGSAGSAGSGGSPPEPNCDFTGWSVGSWKTLTLPSAITSATGYTRHALGMAVDPSNPGTFYATWHVWSGGTNNNSAAGVYKSTDCGSTWTDFGGFGQMHDVYVCPADPDRIWVNNGVRGEFGIWRTDDGGMNWDKLVIEDGNLTGAQNAAIMSDPNDTMRFVPDEDDPSCNHFLLSSHTGSTAGAGGIYRTVDGGDTWTGYPALSGWNTGNAISIVPAFPRGCTGMECTKDSFWLLGAQDTGGGWWVSYDEGINWDKNHSVIMSHGAQRPYRDGIGQAWIGGTIDYPARSADNGDTWTKIGTVDSGQYWTAIGGVPSGTVSPHTGMTSSWAGRVIAGRWNQCGNCTSSVRYTTETTSPTACFSNCASCSNCVQNTSGLTDQGSHDFVTDKVNGLLYMSLMSQGIRVLRY